MSVIQCEGLFFAYRDVPVLEDVNFEIAKGDFLAIIGPNGGGKTTLLRCMIGLLNPLKGNIKVLGKNPVNVRDKIGYVPQRAQHEQMFPVTTYDLILTGATRKAKIFGHYPKKVHQKAEELIEKLTLQQQKKSPFHALSGGMQQKAFLARALISEPEVLFLDESMSGIDLPTKKEILSFLFSLKGSCTILMVTHDLHVAVEKVKRFLCVEKKATLMKPEEVCEHFAIGLYHSPLGEHD